jgi:two-component system nitrogen regulation sensor histidine kinase NtrY
VTFRQKLLAIVTGIVVLAVLAVTIAVSWLARSAFERQERHRSEALAAQFRREFDRSGDEVSRQVEAIAAGEAARRISYDRQRALGGAYINDAEAQAASRRMDFLEFVSSDGTILSCAEFPARFGYKDAWSGELARLSSAGAAMRRQELPNGSAVGLFAVRAVRGESTIYVLGGRRLDRDFLSSLLLPSGSSALLYVHSNRGPQAEDFVSAGSAPRDFSKLVPIVAQAEHDGRDAEQMVHWSADPSDSESVHAIPLRGAADESLGVLLVGSSQAELVQLERHIRSVALLVAGIGIIVAVLASGWMAARVTRPVEQLAAGASSVAAGDWDTRVEVASSDEVGRLAASFNDMTRQLRDQQERMVQAERVAAWRELARRLAHELKNPLFPLQITIENLVRARELPVAEFEEVFRESTATLLAELANLKAIIARFSDFSKMPQPQFQQVQVNEVVEQVAKLFQPELQSAVAGGIEMRLELDRALPPVEADRDLLHRALSNLVLNAQDAMANGGTLSIRTSRSGENAIIEVTDTGSGMTAEECARLFTPYYTTKQYGTGLGLAMVQSVVSDHGGKICVASEPRRGSTFRIELPIHRSCTARAPENDLQTAAAASFAEQERP